VARRTRRTRRTRVAGTVAPAALAVGLVATAALFLPGGCASADRRGGDRGVVIDVKGAAPFRGPAAFTTRVEGHHARSVVTVVGLGEVLVGDDGCRFARLGDGGALAVWRHDGSCAERRGDRLCFDGVTFVDDDAVVRAVVDGCADRNEVFLDRIAGDPRLADLAPPTLIERCVDVRARDPGFLLVVDIVVDDNDQPWRGVRWRHDGDAFGVCFLSRAAGHYRVDVVVEDPRPRRVVLQGAVDEL
jgi:hypothetical protein